MSEHPGRRQEQVGRRRVLTGVAAGLAALGLERFARPATTRAAAGDVMRVGATNYSGGVSTSITRSEGSGDPAVTFDHPLAAVIGKYTTGTGQVVAGVLGEGLTHGVHGRVSNVNGVGVAGVTSGHNSQVAVDGVANTGLGEGIAVRARTLNGIGLYAQATGGHAIQVHGRAVFDRSGKVSFAQGQSSRTVSGYTVAADTLVVATIQGNVAGTYVRGVSLSASNNTFTIRLNKSAPKALKAGYFIVN